jgi:hypothetical protein
VCCRPLSTGVRIVEVMRHLRFVGPGDDSDHVIVESVDGGEQFSLVIDERLRSAARSDLPSLAGMRAAENVISPREIQVRVRAGESPDALAAEADIPVERVLIFARPVLQERVQVTGEARRARARRSTPEGQLVEFGPAVDERFSAHGIEPSTLRWSARRREDGQWVISVTWRGGDSDRTADWAFSLASRLVTPLDETAADLLSDRPIRPVVQVVPDPPEPDPGPGPGGLPTGVPVVVADDVFDQERTASASVAGTMPLPQLDDESTPPLPLRLADPLPDAEAPRSSDGTITDDATDPAAGDPVGDTEDQRAARARIPSWDDILLGVRRKRD